MRGPLLPIVALLGLSASALGQAHSSPDTQTLQALLSEVRALRQELRVSLNRAQNTQILLARLQIQEGAITRAADRLNQARQKLSDTELHQKELGLEQKQLEESPPATDPQEQSDLLDKINRVKSDLEVTAHLAHEQQTAEIQAEQHLREEQDKGNALENQLDELMANTDNSSGKPGASRR
jgi:chromosome segregation ATPase